MLIMVEVDGAWQELCLATSVEGAMVVMAAMTKAAPECRVGIAAPDGNSVQVYIPAEAASVDPSHQVLH